jgi:hypothetical protein
MSVFQSCQNRFVNVTLEMVFNRITSLKISNTIMCDFVFSSIGSLSKLNRIKTLIFDNSITNFRCIIAILLGEKITY